jgi:hypothetical protein
MQPRTRYQIQQEKMRDAKKRHDRDMRMIIGIFLLMTTSCLYGMIYSVMRGNIYGVLLYLIGMCFFLYSGCGLTLAWGGI